ncbi:hypothetical protein N7448_004109 [Penicillium atrosanguineum]|uniref:Uncharacterized protein n=1 Tax=Penicillium atrosanguineum TaxID=1132637 RepID=A0A9W9PZ76_9EURO|nr:uncharacterized protein N7443_003073 [Penicillium atrosanguineum]KAJ5117164.1 hypothetical protein N7526_011273 [Penicillium atrosanguineum]KAJ5140701.1 hypothetical protein N7448_004109 [Penicillium atrosanguineum]KAJ5310612.1 hypothetical protein N7443_003073 [Penicillium atrosanguineum]KAJ5316134.1 hypothetical protein N7476_006441 [Penicillium atrosanguineum]
MELTEGRARFSFSSHRKEKQASSFQDDRLSTAPTDETSRGTFGIRRALGRDLHLSSVSEQTEELLKTTNHTLAQLQEAQRLRQLKQPLLEASERSWIDHTLEDVADAAHEAAIILEPMRVEKETRNGRVSFGRQLRWVYRDNQRAQSKNQRLLASHHSLMLVLGHLQRLNSPDLTTPESPVVHELADTLSMDSTRSLSDWQRLRPEPNGPTKNAEEVMGPRSPLNNEMHDMLAWRRSKGALAETKHRSGATTEKLDIGPRVSIWAR